MKLTTNTNDSIVIQARNEKDYQKALEVAERIVEGMGSDICAIAEINDTEMWINVTAVWDNFQAKDLKFFYAEAKK